MKRLRFSVFILVLLYPACEHEDPSGAQGLADAIGVGSHRQLLSVGLQLLYRGQLLALLKVLEELQLRAHLPDGRLAQPGAMQPARQLRYRLCRV